MRKRSAKHSVVIAGNTAFERSTTDLQTCLVVMDLHAERVFENIAQGNVDDPIQDYLNKKLEAMMRQLHIAQQVEAQRSSEQRAQIRAALSSTGGSQPLIPTKPGQSKLGSATDEEKQSRLQMTNYKRLAGC